MAEIEYTAEELEREEWRTCPGFPDYSVSSLGRLRRDVAPRNGCRAGRIMPGTRSIYGYLQTSLTHEGKGRTCKLHRLVALAFLGDPPEGKPNINHINAIRTDNRVENLEWASYQDDADHRVRMGRVPTGDQHWSRRHPERVTRGDQHGSRLHPERTARGERHCHAKLTEASVRAARKRCAAGESTQSVAADLGVSSVTVRDAVARRTWRHVH